MSDEYIKLKSALKVVFDVVSDEGVKHKGKAIRKRLKELPTRNITKAKIQAVSEFAESVVYDIVNIPSEFSAIQASPDFLNGMAHRQNEILEIIKKKAGDKK